MRDTVNHPVLLITLHRLLLATALLILVFYLAVYVAYAINLMRFPFDYDQGEGFELVDTLLFSQGRWPYLDTEVFPFYSSNYPPLFHVIAAPFVWLFGPAYWYGRLLGFLSTLVTAAAIAYAVYREGARRSGQRAYLVIAVLSGLAYLASNTVYHIGPLFRQHAAMVMFEMLAVVVLAHAPDSTRPRRRRTALVAGMLLLIAAGYTKQLAAVTLAAAALFLFLRGPLRALLWTALAAAVGAAIFAWMNAATGGEWWRQAILANVNELQILQTVSLFRQWFSLHGFLIVPAALLALYELYFDRLSLYSIWFALAIVVNGAASGTWGGGDSYFATAIAATCVLSGIFAARTLAGHWSFPDNYLSRRLIFPLRRHGPALGAASLVLIPLLYVGYGRAVLHLPTQEPGFQQVAQLLNIQPNARNGFYDSARTADGQYPGGYASIGHFTTEADIAAGWRIVELMRQTDGLVLSEEAGFSLQAGREVITNPTQLLNLDKKRLYDGSALIEMIERQDFGLIVLRAQFYPERVLQAIGRAYERADVIEMNGFDYFTLRPRPRSALPAGATPSTTTRAE
jgi:hypothetical protein